MLLKNHRKTFECHEKMKAHVRKTETLGLVTMLSRMQDESTFLRRFLPTMDSPMGAPRVEACRLVDPTCVLMMGGVELGVAGSSRRVRGASSGSKPRRGGFVHP